MCHYCQGRHSLRDTRGRFTAHRVLAVIREEWRLYIDSMLDRAEEETRGHLLSRAGFLRGVSVVRILAGESRGAFASQELRDWLRAHRVLTFAEYRSQMTDAA